MKSLFVLFALILPLHAQQGEGGLVQIPPRQIVPLEVKASAQEAVKKVVEATMRGDFQTVLDSMNPEFVKIISRPYGGPARFKAGMLHQMKDMGKNGLIIDGIIALPADTAFEVDYGIVDRMVDGQLTKVGEYRKWMVFVPTVKDFQFLDPTTNPPTLKRFRKRDFEIAISPKEVENWTFINGSSTNALQLRKLFPFLPKEDAKLNFPPIKNEERPTQ